MWPEILGAMVEGFALSLFLWTVIRGQKRLTWGQKEKNSNTFGSKGQNSKLRLKNTSLSKSMLFKKSMTYSLSV